MAAMLNWIAEIFTSAAGKHSALYGLLFDPNGPGGFSRDFAENMISSVVGILLGALVTSLFVERYIHWRERRRWRKVRQSLGRRLNYPHRAMLSHFELLCDVIVAGRLKDLDSDGFRSNLMRMREEVEAHIARFGFAIDAKTSESVELYRQAFSYIVGISRYVSKGESAVVRWRAPTPAPEAIFMCAHQSLMAVWRACDLLSEVPADDMRSLIARAKKVDAQLARLITIERRQAGYLREKLDQPDPHALVHPPLEPEGA